jgi:two-component system, NtrC family, response regulator HydG
VSGAPAARILVVEDNETLRRSIVRALSDKWGGVDAVDSGERAIGCLADPQESPYDVVLTDLRLPGADGLAVLRAARDRDPRTSVLVMTAFGTIDAAVQAMRCGAYDFVQKPIDLEQLELRVARAVDQRRLLDEVEVLRAERAGRRTVGPMVGCSKALQGAVALARRVASSRSTVLVTGETGTGKELIAGLIHSASSRANGPLVKVNCAALPEPLLESELFGHERGAFTGADRRRRGRFEEASGGTLLLDEVGDLSAATQAKLLRVLQDQEFHRVGGTHTLRTDARIVAATNGDLEAEVGRGRFREDLYFRLNVIRIHLPPLRERGDDVLALAHHFVADLAPSAGRDIKGFTPEALLRLRSHDWPGNVRELHNTLERAVLLCEGPHIRAEELSFANVGSDAAAENWRPALPPPGWTLADVERALVVEALQRSGYVQKEACVRLGVSRRKLNYMIRRMGITHPSWRRNRTPAESSEAQTP